MKKFVISLYLVCFVAISCKFGGEPEGPIGNVMMLKSPTHCNEPWQSGQNKTENIANITKYLGQNAIEIITIAIVDAPAGLVVCEACNCKNGQQIRVVVATIDVDKMISLGFTKK